MKASLSVWLLVAAAGSASAAALSGDSSVNRHDLQLEKRGKVHDAMSIIRQKKKCGTDFCSTFLHLPTTPVVTKTVTVTQTVNSRVPSSTLSTTAVITKTASAVTRTNTQLSVVKVTPTVSKTVVTEVPFSSTVTTVTSFVTSTATNIVSTVTSYTPPVRVRKAENKDSRIPTWLNGYCADTVSKACSHLVSATTVTKTKTKTITVTRSTKSGIATVIGTNTVAITPTSTVTVVKTSTSTAPAVTSIVGVTTSTLVPLTATATATTVVTATATATVTLTQPVRGYIRVLNRDAGGVVGNIGPLDGSGRSSVVPLDDSSAIVVEMPYEAFVNGGGPFNLAIVGAEGTTEPFLGAASRDGYDDLAPGSWVGVVMSTASQTEPNTAAHGSTGYGIGSAYLGSVQSAIWNHDQTNGNALSITWTNPDGSAFVNPSAMIFTADPNVRSTVYWTGDAAAFNQQSGGFEEGILIFVPLQ
ncbi:hypothetical protein OC835_006697 [Tilletia horrida]|nr:hypothetical protein OC835_006697 [Tilletia horrida]